MFEIQESERSASKKKPLEISEFLSGLKKFFKTVLWRVKKTCRNLMSRKVREYIKLAECAKLVSECVLNGTFT